MDSGVGIGQSLLSTYSEPKHKLVTGELEITHQKKEKMNKEDDSDGRTLDLI